MATATDGGVSLSLSVVILLGPLLAVVALVGSVDRHRFGSCSRLSHYEHSFRIIAVTTPDRPPDTQLHSITCTFSSLNSTTPLYWCCCYRQFATLLKNTVEWDGQLSRIEMRHRRRQVRRSTITRKDRPRIAHSCLKHVTFSLNHLKILWARQTGWRNSRMILGIPAVPHPSSCAIVDSRPRWIRTANHWKSNIPWLSARKQSQAMAFLGNAQEFHGEDRQTAVSSLIKVEILLLLLYFCWCDKNGTLKVVDSYILLLHKHTDPDWVGWMRKIIFIHSSSRNYVLIFITTTTLCNHSDRIQGNCCVIQDNQSPVKWSLDTRENKQNLVEKKIMVLEWKYRFTERARILTVTEDSPTKTESKWEMGRRMMCCCWKAPLWKDSWVYGEREKVLGSNSNKALSLSYFSLE